MVLIRCEETCIRGEKMQTVVVYLKLRDLIIGTVWISFLLISLFWSELSLLGITSNNFLHKKVVFITWAVITENRLYNNSVHGLVDLSMVGDGACCTLEGYVGYV